MSTKDDEIKKEVYDEIEKFEWVTKGGKQYRDKKYKNKDDHYIRVNYYNKKFYVKGYDSGFMMEDTIDKNDAQKISESNSKKVIQLVREFCNLNYENIELN